MRLRKWMDLEGYNQEEAAKHLDVPVATLRNWLYRHSRPKWETMMKVQRRTGHRVRPEDWDRDKR